MARARSIKPGFFLNESLASLHPLTRILFEGLWCHADREGRLEDRPRRIKAEVLPYDDHDVDVALQDLVQAGFILRYRNCTNDYIQILAFKKHQNPHVKEAPSTIPAPDEHGASTVLVGAGSGTSTACADSRHDVGRHVGGSEDTSVLDTSQHNIMKNKESSTSTVQAPDKHGAKTPLTLNPIPLTFNPEPPNGGVQGGCGDGAPDKHRASTGHGATTTLPAAPPKGAPILEKMDVRDINGLNSAAFAEWDCERRRRGGKSRSCWTDVAQVKAAKFLSGYSSEDQQAIVDKSIVNGWQGLFPPNKGNDSKKFDPGEYMIDKVRKGYEH